MILDIDFRCSCTLGENANSNHSNILNTTFQFISFFEKISDCYSHSHIYFANFYHY